MSEKALSQLENEALGRCHLAGQSLLLQRPMARQAFAAALACENYARAAADQAVAEVSTIWAVLWRTWHEAAVTWMQIAQRAARREGVELWEASENS